MLLVGKDFVAIAKTMAKSEGLSVLPHWVLPRTINTMQPEEIEGITEKFAEEIITILEIGSQN